MARVIVCYCYSPKSLPLSHHSETAHQQRYKQNYGVINCYPTTLHSQPAFVVFVKVFKMNTINFCLNWDATAGTLFAGHTVCI